MALIMSTIICCLLSHTVSGADIQRKPLHAVEITPSEDTVVIVTELILPPGSSIPPHTHPGDEFLYVLEGGTVIMSSGAVINFEPGMSDHFPRGEIHGGFTVSGNQSLKVITTHIVDQGAPLIIPVSE